MSRIRRNLKCTAGWIGALLAGSSLGSAPAMAQPIVDADVRKSSFTRITWLSQCELGSAGAFFLIDVSADGTLRYEGIADVKRVGVHTEKLSREGARQLRSAARDFLAEPANSTIDDDGSGTPCLGVEDYEAGRAIRSRSEPLRTNSPAALLRIVDRLATPKKWACPGRLSMVRGFRSAKYCNEQPAFVITAAGQSACELTRHVEAYLDGTLYVATYGPHLKELRDHRYYDIGSSAITSLVDAINTFETTAVELEQLRPTKGVYFRDRPEDVERIKARLSALARLEWSQPEHAGPCDEPAGRPKSSISLRSDLDRAEHDWAQ